MRVFIQEAEVKVMMRHVEELQTEGLAKEHQNKQLQVTSEAIVVIANLPILCGVTMIHFAETC